MNHHPLVVIAGSVATYAVLYTAARWVVGRLARLHLDYLASRSPIAAEVIEQHRRNQ